MSNEPPTEDRAARIAALQARRAAGATGSGRRSHPARGARAVALVASLASTGGIGAALYQANTVPDLAASGTDVPIDPATTTTAAATTATAARAATQAGLTAGDTSQSAAAARVTTATPTTTPTTTAAAAASTAATTAAGSTAATAYRDGTYLGAAQTTRWGDVQVKVTISAGRISAVTAVQVPSDGKSSTINNRAVPILTSQAIARQSARLDVVSGATYTSRTYATSLQSALDKAAATTAAR